MSDIVINAENFKRFSKRLQKSTKTRGLEISLSEAQNLLAETFGVADYLEMSSKLKMPDPAKSHMPLIRPETPWPEESVLSIVEHFISKLKTILSKKDSSIMKCYIDEDFGNIILNFVSYNGDGWGLYFGSSSTIQKVHLTSCSISESDAEDIINLVKEYVPDNKYEGLLFGSKLMEYDRNIANQQTIFKYQLEPDGRDIILDDIYYSLRYAIVTLDYLTNRIFEKKNSGVKNGFLHLDHMIDPSGFEDFHGAIQSIQRQNITESHLQKVVIELYKPSFLEKTCLVKDVWHYEGDNLLHKNIADFRKI